MGRNRFSLIAGFCGLSHGLPSRETRRGDGAVAETRLKLARSEILSFRRQVGSLNLRLPWSQSSLRRAAWAGLQDSMPRAALLSIHARVHGTRPWAWADSSLIQTWGPRFNVFVVPACDRAVFTLGTMPENAKGRHRAEDLAQRLKALLKGEPMPYGEAGHALGVHPNLLRYAAATGTILIRWEGARQPTVWTVPAPEMDIHEARLELARRYLHVYGPAAPEAFGTWAGIGGRHGIAAFEALRGDLTPVRTPIGDGWILTRDVEAFRGNMGASPPARLLPSGDPYLLLQGADRELLIPDAEHRSALWTPRVWPGGLLVGGEIVGTWRRSDATMTIQLWRRLTSIERDAVMAEAESLPLPGIEGRILVRWED